METIIYGVILGLLGFILGIRQSKRNVKRLNKEVTECENIPDSFDDFKLFVENSGVDIGNVLDISFHYGFDEGFNNGIKALKETP